MFPARADGSISVTCVRAASDQPVTTGLGGWRHVLSGPYTAPSPLPSFLPAGRLAPLDVRDHVYRAILSEHPLLERHSKELAARGLSEAAILVNSYRSWGWCKYQRGPIAQSVCATEIHAIDVPGIVVREQSRGQYVTLNGSAGIAIPIRNASGQIQALQIKPDDPARGKYLWLSSASRGGASPGTPIHVARPSAATSPAAPNALSLVPGRVLLTEGALKADIAAELLGLVVIAIPGVGALKALPETLLELQKRGELKELIVALDMDYHTNLAVRTARNLIAERAARLGIPVYLADWAVECKGLDDVLVAGGRLKLTAYQVQGNGPREIIEAPPASTIVAATLTVSLKLARQQQQAGIDAYLDRDRRNQPNVGLLLGAIPGMGKSHVITKALNRWIKKHKRKRAAVIVSRHDQAREAAGRELWDVVRGRTHALKDAPPPCVFPERQKKLTELRIVGQQGCKACASEAICKGNTRREQTIEPFYLNQFARDPAARIKVYQAAHLMTPTAWADASVVVLDDVSIRDLQLETVTLGRTDLEYALAWIELHPDAAYAHAQPLLHLVSEVTRQASQGEFSLSGAALFTRLEQLAAEHNMTLTEALERAGQAQDPDPFPAGITLADARLDVPKRFIKDLIGVLSHEHQQAQAEREIEGWNRRVEVSRVLGGDVMLTLTLRRELPIAGLAGKDLIISDASANVEELQKIFPHITHWIVVAPQVEIPSSVKVIQYPDRAWGKRAMHDEKVQKQALEHIRKIVDAHPNAKISFFSYKFLGPIVREAFPQLIVGHFYAQRGSNKFANCDVEIVLGAPRPNPKSFVQMAEALHWDEAPLNLQTTLQQRRIGTHLVKVREYVDSRLQELSRAKTSEEMIQTIGRIRPLSVIGFLDGPEQMTLDFGEVIREAEAQERKAATVYVLSNLPLPGIKVEVRLTPPSPCPRPPRPELVTSEIIASATDLLDNGALPSAASLAEAGDCKTLHIAPALPSLASAGQAPVQPRAG